MKNYDYINIGKAIAYLHVAQCETVDGRTGLQWINEAYNQLSNIEEYVIESD